MLCAGRPERVRKARDMIGLFVLCEKGREGV